MTGRVWPAALALVLLLSAALWAQDRRPRVIFLGDSLTAGGPWAAALPEIEAVNLGVSGDTTAMILARLDQVVEARPEIIFLQAGINDFGRRESERIILDNHRAIWRRLQEELPGLRLVLVSLLPVSERRYPGWNGRIRDFNRQLRAEAEKQGLTFIDLQDRLVDKDGQLSPDFSPDGLHLTIPGYGPWVMAVKSELAEKNHD